MGLFALAAIPAGVAIATNAQGTTPNPAPTNQAPNGGALVTAGAASSGSTIDQQLTKPYVPVGSLAKRRLLSASVNSTGVVGVSTGMWGDAAPNLGPIDAALQQKLDEINAYGAAAYEKLSSDAKKAGAKVLNDELKLDPPLSGNESWEDVAKIAGGAAGAAALGWLPGGQVLGPMVGAYLGVKLEELVAKNVDEIKAWFKGKWSDIESWVKGAASDVEDAVKDTISYIGGWF